MSTDMSMVADLIVIFGASLFVGRKAGQFVGYLMEACLEKKFKDEMK